jgi:hypothetical protein
MTDQTNPSGGGSYVREKDGSLRLVEAPTSTEPPVEAQPKTAVEAPVEGPVKAPVNAPASAPSKPARKEA